MLFTPFLPFSSQTLHELLGYDGWLAGPLEFREVDEEDGATHEVLTGDYESWVGRWEPSELPPGQKLREPQPLFRKLDPSRSSRTSSRGWAQPRRDRHARAPRRAATTPASAVARAREAGVDARSSRSAPGSTSCRAALALAERHDGVYAALGIHPHQAGGAEADDASTSSRALLAHPKAVAVGETGPRHYRDYAPRDGAAARSSRRSSRSRRSSASRSWSTRARRTTTRVASSAGIDGTVVLHCFSAPGLLDPALERGWYVSFAGNVTYPKADELREAARARPGRPAPRRDRQPVPRAAAGARPAERAGERRPHARGARRGARRGRRTSSPRGSTRTRAQPSASP